MKSLLKIIGLLFTGLLLYLLFWPISIEPKAWTPPAAPSMEDGPYQVNTLLVGAKQISVAEFGNGPEDVALDTSSYIYAGLFNGKILRFQPDGTAPEVFANTEGRPLGLHFDTLGNLIVADAIKGLLSVDNQGNIKLLTKEAEGVPYNFADDLDIAQDGTIYFSDASYKFSVSNFKDDVMEHSPDGRLLAYYPSTKETKVLADQLYFANGVAVSPDQQFVLVNETTMYRVLKHWIAGPKKGQTEVFIDNLPGFPDGISSNGKGTFWLAMANPRNAILDKTLPHPFIRKMIFRLPEFLHPKEVHYGMIFGLDMNGNVIHNFQDPSGDLAPITSVQEENGKLYIGTLTDDALGVIDAPR